MLNFSQKSAKGSQVFNTELHLACLSAGAGEFPAAVNSTALDSIESS